MNPNLLSNAIFAIATLHARLGLDPQTLKLHREDPLTTHLCPGVSVVKADFIHSLSARLIQLFPGEHPAQVV